MKKGTKIVYIVLCAVFAGIFLFAGYKLLEGEIGYYLARRAYSSLGNKYVTSSKDTKTSAASESESAGEDEIVLDPEISPINVDFDEVKKECPDVVGWIYSPTITIINYPIVRFDDNSWYLKHRYDGVYSESGSIFVDCTNLPDFGNDNTILYGHHMNDGSMFAKIVNYNNQEFYENNPVMYINTPKMNYRLEIFAGYVTDDNDQISYKFDFSDDKDQQKFIDYAYSKSKFTSIYDIQPGDKFVTFSTCTYEYDNARYVLHSRMIPIH